MPAFISLIILVSMPTKWMSEDGTSLYYLFSGDDSFSVRKLTLKKK